MQTWKKSLYCGFFPQCGNIDYLEDALQSHNRVKSLWICLLKCQRKTAVSGTTETVFIPSRFGNRLPLSH